MHEREKEKAGRGERICVCVLVGVAGREERVPCRILVCLFGKGLKGQKPQFKCRDHSSDKL